MNSKRTVILHIADFTDDISRAVSTATTLQATFPEARIRVIINGEALNSLPYLTDESLPAGVEVSACRTGLYRRGIDDSRIADGIEIVPHASVAIIEEQFAGAVYLRL